MTMKTKTRLRLFGMVVFLAAGFPLVYYQLQEWAAPYQQSNAIWTIEGLCTDVQNGVPIIDAQVTASFIEAWSFKHHWRNPPPVRTTNVDVTTDAEGRFVVTGEGGSVVMKVHAEGYRDQEPWEYWKYTAMNRIVRVNTNLFLTLKPKPGAMQDQRSSGL